MVRDILFLFLFLWYPYFCTSLFHVALHIYTQLSLNLFSELDQKTQILKTNWFFLIQYFSINYRLLLIIKNMYNNRKKNSFKNDMKWLLFIGFFYKLDICLYHIIGWELTVEIYNVIILNIQHIVLESALRFLMVSDLKFASL